MNSERRVQMNGEKGLGNNDDTDKQPHSGTGSAKWATKNDSSRMPGEGRKFTMGSVQLLKNTVLKQMPSRNTTVNIDQSTLLSLKLPDVVVDLYHLSGPEGFLLLVRELQNELSSSGISLSIINYT